MCVNQDCAIIKYAGPDTEFKYFKLFIQTVEPYILDYKNVEYDKLTDKDKSVSLARIIKSMEVNGQPVTVFFADILKKWEEKDNFEKNQLFVEFMAKEIFGCYDKARAINDKFYKSPYIFSIVTDGEKDYFEPKKPSLFDVKINKIKGKTTEEIEMYEYFLKLKQQEKRGMLLRYRMNV